MKRLAVTLAMGLLFLACGDGNQPKPVSGPEAETPGQARPAAQPAGGGYGSQPASAPSGGGAPPATHGGGTVEKPAELVALEQAYEKSKDDATKKKLVQATYEFGKKVNYDPALAPRTKYPTALRLFRRVLELDPNHQQAAAEKTQIEDIYRSMGRPIPQ